MLGEDILGSAGRLGEGEGVLLVRAGVVSEGELVPVLQEGGERVEKCLSPKTRRDKRIRCLWHPFITQRVSGDRMVSQSVTGDNVADDEPIDKAHNWSVIAEIDRARFDIHVTTLKQGQRKSTCLVGSSRKRVRCSWDDESGLAGILHSHRTVREASSGVVEGAKFAGKRQVAWDQTVRTAVFVTCKIHRLSWIPDSS